MNPIDFLADYCHWLAQAGHSERALAIWQANIEFNCFRPPDLYSSSFEQRILEMELFWSSGAARFGQPGSQNWATWFIHHNKQKKLSNHSKMMKKSTKNTKFPDLISEFSSNTSVNELASKWKEVTGRLKGIRF